MYYFKELYENIQSIQRYSKYILISKSTSNRIRIRINENYIRILKYISHIHEKNFFL